MKNGKAVGPNDRIGSWLCLGEMTAEVLTKSFYKIFESERMPK